MELGHQARFKYLKPLQWHKIWDISAPELLQDFVWPNLCDNPCAGPNLPPRRLRLCIWAHRAGVDLHHQPSPCQTGPELSPEIKAQLNSDEFCYYCTLMLKNLFHLFIISFLNISTSDCFSAGPAFLRSLPLLLICFKAVSVCFIRKEKARTFLIWHFSDIHKNFRCKGNCISFL